MTTLSATSASPGTLAFSSLRPRKSWAHAGKAGVALRLPISALSVRRTVHQPPPTTSPFGRVVSTPATSTAPVEAPALRGKRAVAMMSSASVNAELETAGPFGAMSPAAALLMLAALGTAHSGGVQVDLQQILAWSVVASAALSQLKTAGNSSPQVPVLAGASLALMALGYGSIEWLTALVFGVALCSKLPQVPIYVGWLTLALAAWQGYAFEWFTLAYGLSLLPSTVKGVQNRNIPLIPALCVLVSVVALLGQFQSSVAPWANPTIWTGCIAMGAAISHILQSVLSLAKENQ